MGKVLVIYTGGTLGMRKTVHGYEPAPGYLFDQLACNPRFHDGSSSAAGATLPVARPHGTEQSPCLTLPASDLRTCVTYTVLEYETLLDSSSIRFEHWLMMARTIERNYTAYDGFVVIHGTDSMAYSSSMLSFLLEHLGKSVIFTGSQIPISQLRNDAQENLLGALLLAGSYVIPEVALFFHHSLRRGNRCTKVDAVGFDAFASPNCLPLATVGVAVEVHWSRIHRPTGRRKLHVEGRLAETDVASLHVFPGIKPSTLTALLSSATLQGLVLQTFGAGNVPADRGLHDALRRGSERGIVVCNITQCLRGGVAPLYAAGAVLREVGVEPGHDMTAECALTKLGYLLARHGPARAKELIGRNLRGELTENTNDAARPYSHAELDGGEGDWLDIEAPPSDDDDDADDADDEKSTVTLGAGAGAAKTQLRTRRASVRRRRPLRHRLADAFLALSKDDVGALERALGPVAETHASTDAEGDGRRGGEVVINAVDLDGRTLLHYAAEKGKSACLNRLLDRGAFIHTRNAKGRTALDLALANGHEDCARLLRETGAH